MGGRAHCIFTVWCGIMIVHPAAPQEESFDTLQRYPNMPTDYFPQAFATPESNHLQYFQDADDHNEWKWETTQVHKPYAFWPQPHHEHFWFSQTLAGCVC
jgi:hypothetical protein